jgi:hypothetical protein
MANHEETGSDGSVVGPSSPIPVEARMTDLARLDRMLDAYEIERVRRRWVFCRDRGDWVGLSACFHPDATVTISWYCGPASGFIERARQAAAAQKPEERSQHWLGNCQAAVRGNRAILESDVQILTRDILDGHLFDCTSFGRFFDLFEKREGAWRITKWTAIYDKDRLDPVLPGGVPPSFFVGLERDGGITNGTFMRLRVTKKGRTVPAGMVLAGSEAEVKVRREGEQWLDGGTLFS